MPIKYHLKDSPLPGLSGKIKLVQSATTMRYSKEQLAQEIVRQGTTVGEADVAAVLTNLGTAVAALCANGISVSLDNLGTFTPRVTGSADQKGNWIKPPKARITVRPDPGLDRAFQKLAQLKAIPAPKICPIISDLPETELPAGGLIRLTGSYLRFHREALDEGVFLVPGKGPEIRLIEYVGNRYSEIVARNLPPGRSDAPPPVPSADQFGWNHHAGCAQAGYSCIRVTQGIGRFPDTAVSGVDDSCIRNPMSCG